MELTTMPQQSGNGMMQVAQSRQAQEVQAAMVIAQKFPRDTMRSYSRIMEDCKRKTLAEKSVYAYPRGGTTVTGPSIRLAECLARAWGNMDFGITELERKAPLGSVPGESVIMTYCYDLETNTKSTTVFTVRHSRDKNIKLENGQKKKIQEQLTDERDIYEMIANQGARRLRACILKMIPVDIVESAVDQCEKTMAGGNGPLIDRVRAMIVYFQGFGVTQEMIEKRVGHKVEAISETELVTLKNIANSLKDGAASREDFFEMPQTEEAKAEATDAKQEVAKSEEKPKKTKSIKNFAPQSAEDAKTHKPGDHTVVEKEITPEHERAEAIKAVLDTQKELKMDNKSLASFVETYFKKKTNDLSTEELQTLHAELLAMKQP